jgi:hypothetical protein
VPLTFVLGAAADPAGTEWLYRQLADMPTFVGGHSEAYHVLDGLRPTDLASTALTDLLDGRPADAAALHRMAMVGNPALYYDYIAALLHQDAEQTLTADVAPEYALLSVEVLTELRDALEARGVRVVPVFVTSDQAETNDAWDDVFGEAVVYAAQGRTLELPPQNV